MTLCNTGLSSGAAAISVFSVARNEQTLSTGGVDVSYLAIHRLAFAAPIFNTIRVTIINPPVGSPTGAMQGGRHDFVFTFASNGTVRDLMFTTQSYLATGPGWNDWKVAFGYRRQNSPWFSRGGSSANSALPSGGFSGACPCVAGSTGPAFGYATNDGTCMVDTGIGGFCSSCGTLAMNSDMALNAGLVLIYAGSH